MSANISVLNPEQIEVVRTYFKTLAKIRGEKYLNPDNEFLSSCTGSYSNIMLEAGGDPVKLAERLA